MLLTSPAYILASYIRGQGLMTDPDDSAGVVWPLYISLMPDNVDVETNCGIVYSTSGIKDGRLMSGEVIQHYGIQLRIRCDDYNIGWAKAESVANNLDSI